MTFAKPSPYQIALAISLLGLLACCEVFFYRVYVVPRNQAAAALRSLSAALEEEAQQASVVAPPAANTPGSASVPDLLGRVQELAVGSGVSVVSVEPLAGADIFKLTFDSSYLGFVRFFARFEALQVAVSGFEVAPVEGKNDLRVAINFTHVTTPSAVHPNVLKEFETRLRTAQLKDPFHPWNEPLPVPAGDIADDLTFTLHLTSISEIGAMRFATIDGRDYQVGDVLEGREVRAIGNESVTLVEKAGAEERQLTLRFREPLEGRI